MDIGHPAPPNRALPRLMLVGGLADTADFVDIVAQAVAGGLRLLQLRDRSSPASQQQTLVDALRRRAPQLTLLINGQPEVARRNGIGLHLPETAALPPTWPPSALWGRSVHSVPAARQAHAEGARYLVLGTIFPTPSKPGHPGAGLELLRQVTHAVPIPVFAIGGIDHTNLSQVITAGAHGGAVRRAILAAANPRKAAQGLLTACHNQTHRARNTR